MSLNLSDILIKLAKVDPLFKPVKREIVSSQERTRSFEARVTDGFVTYNSSISAGVLRATSGRINQAMITETKPVPAKLQYEMHVSISLWHIVCIGG